MSDFFSHLHRFSCPSSGCIQQGRSSWSQPSDRCSNGSSRHFQSNTRCCLCIRRYTQFSNSIHDNHFPNSSSIRQWTHLFKPQTMQAIQPRLLGLLLQSFFPGCDVVWFFLFFWEAMLLSIYPNSDIFPCLIISGYWADDKIRLHSPHSLMGSSDLSLQSLCLLHTFSMLIHSPLLHLNMVGPSHTFSVEKNRAVWIEL